MPTESIVFSPELAERELDKQANKVNETFSEATDDLQANFEDMEMDGLMPAGMGDGMGDGGMMGGPAGVSAITSMLPGTVSGVVSSAAMPVALAGGVGLGILSEMTSASARLQTSNAILGQAWTEVWQVIGGKVDQLFWRDTATDIAEELRGMADLFRDGKWLEGLNLGLTGQAPDPLGGANLGEELGTILGGAGGLYGGAKAGAIAGGTLGSIIPGAGTAAGAVVGGGIGGLAGLLLGSRAGGGLGADIMQWWRQNVPAFSWPDLPDWPGWPNVKDLWPGWPDVKVDWPGWPDLPELWKQSGGWPDIGLPDWPSAGQILGQFPSINPSSIRNAILGNDSPDTGGPLVPDWVPGDGPWFGASGGVVTGPTRAVIGEGQDDEAVVPLSQLAGMLDSERDRGARDAQANVDTSEVESKLDELNRNVRRLASALSVEGVGPEEIARLASDGQTNRVGDTNPRT